jgi:hypothetical protein
MSDNVEVLIQIRDLLIPISAVAKAQLADTAPHRIRSIVGSGQRQRAASSMDGSRTRVQIQQHTGISAPNLSTLIKELREAGLVTESDSKPRLAVGPAGIWPASGTRGRQ